MIRYLQNIISDTHKIRGNGSTIKLSILMVLLLATQLMSAQISGSFSFEDSLQGWTTVGYGEFAQTDAETCGLGNSARANVFFNGINNFISPSLGTANGNQITMTFDYKVVEYSDLQPAAGYKVDIKAQWSNSADGPWNTFFTINASTHIPSINCVTKTATFIPLAGPLFVRLQNKAVGINSDLYYYYDTISFSQGTAATCAPATSVVVDPQSVTATGLIVSWIAPTFTPPQGYEYEIRTSGIAGSGPLGLAANGSVEAGITLVNITELSPNTTYTIFIRSKCSPTEFSSWSSSVPRTTLCIAVNIPYIMPLSSAVVPDMPNCVTLENVNTDDRYWKTINSTPGITGKVLQYTYNYAMPADDWFFTPMLNLSAGTPYRIAFKYKVSQYQEKLEVAVGSSPSANAMITTLLNLTIPSTTSGAHQQFIDFTIPSDGEYSIGFQVHSNANSNLLYIGEVSVNFGPTCIPPTEVTVSNINKTSATISWTAATIFPQNGYVYEIRTSAAAGSGSDGLTATGTTAAGITTVDLENLDPESDYKIYVASRCNGEDQSTWTSSIKFKTLCDYLQLEAINDTICEGSTATLKVSNTDEHIDWYETQTSSEIIHTGPVFITPELAQTTSYFAKATVIEADQLVKIGDGDQIATTYQNPFYSVWSNNHTQHIIPMQELHNQDMIAGPINSVALTITNAGVTSMIGLTIKIGSTTTTELSEFVDNSTFDTVFTSLIYMPILGTNIFEFETPYNWDGTSNIVLEFCHGNPLLSATMNRGVLADDTEYISTIKASFTTATAPSVVCANTTTNTTTYNNRPVFIFSGTILCEAPLRTEVVATVDQVEPITASSSQSLTVEALEDATLADLEPYGSDILWYSNLQAALTLEDELPISTQLQSGQTYYAVRKNSDCYSAPFAVLVTLELGTANQSFENLTYFPNPVKHHFSIYNSQEISKIKVFNIIGQEVLTLSPHASIVKIDMSSFSGGTYFIHLNTATTSKIIKMIKE